jgi:hypothetical protein
MKGSEDPFTWSERAVANSVPNIHNDASPPNFLNLSSDPGFLGSQSPRIKDGYFSKTPSVILGMSLNTPSGQVCDWIPRPRANVPDRVD